MTINERIKKRRLEIGMSVDELAQKIGKNRATVYRYENTDIENLPVSILEPIAKALKTTPAALMGWSEYSGIKNLTPVPSTYTVPRLGNIACGSPIYAEENFDGTDEVPEELRNIDFTLVCKGDSMIDARIHDGDIVYLREQPTVENGEIAAVLIDDEATLKRFYRHGDTVSLVAANPAYPPMVFKREEINHLRIIGLAVAFTSRIET